MDARGEAKVADAASKQAPTPKVPQEFAQATVLSPTEGEVRVREIWAESTAVIVLVRHFG